MAFIWFSFCCTPDTQDEALKRQSRMQVVRISLERMKNAKLGLVPLYEYQRGHESMKARRMSERWCMVHEGRVKPIEKNEEIRRFFSIVQ